MAAEQLCLYALTEFPSVEQYYMFAHWFEVVGAPNQDLQQD